MPISGRAFLAVRKYTEAQVCGTRWLTQEDHSSSAGLRKVGRFGDVAAEEPPR